MDAASAGDWSPKQISGYLRLNCIRIRHERIYQEIRSDQRGELRSRCRHKMKYRRHVGRQRKTAGRTLIANRVSIHERPAEADSSRFGDWEMDLVIGKGQKSTVLTMVKRYTNILLQKNGPQSCLCAVQERYDCYCCLTKRMC
ncbi:MAG: IS30 family transposase [Muribaculaceae bacterium]|nr:IS30 family transposase [Muribaculaceae bacterium]